ncbi:MAG: spore coat protein CotH [Tissierellia bacterium]|nr:spore coat protein CotH [Tissierellia bacterium]
MAITLVFIFVVMSGFDFGIRNVQRNPVYKDKLFDKTRVHKIDIRIQDKEAFFDKALEENYVASTVVIDGEKFSNVGLRTKGNNSLRLTNKYGHQRYSLKLEFDQFEPKSYYGLDKFSLDSSFQDNAYMKTYLSMDMFDFMGVKTPSVSYTWVTINGEDWGLFLAIEEPEEAFAKRNFGADYGQLYKPGYRSLNDPNHDVYLQYTDDDINSYDNIFRKAKFNPSEQDKKRLIESLKILDSGENLDKVVNIDEVLRYFVVQVFVVNLDSYLGKTGHNYFLHEKDGIMTMLPWDYNLAFATYSLGMPNPINDSNLYVNFPIDTPNSGDVMLNRPLYHKLMLNPEYFKLYRSHFDHFIKEYIESGRFDKTINEVSAMIAPYVEKDPTAFINYEDHKIGVKTIENFIKLRAKSVRLQLDGVIPSTIKGQEDDKSNFVDASSVSLPDMGEVKDLKDGIH